jgi:hypothetical protein
VIDVFEGVDHLDSELFASSADEEEVSQLLPTEQKRPFSTKVKSNSVNQGISLHSRPNSEYERNQDDVV